MIFVKNKKLFNIYDIDVDKTLISKKWPYGKKAHLNTFLDTMMMMSLELNNLSSDMLLYSLIALLFAITFKSLNDRFSIFAIIFNSFNNGFSIFTL